jgi:hypothetical protein
MKIKLFEIRDRATLIPAIAIQVKSPVNDAERYLMKRCGFQVDEGEYHSILFGKLTGETLTADAYSWTGPRTMGAAHIYIEENWDLLETGEVICVETILGEREEPKTSGRLEQS